MEKYIEDEWVESKRRLGCIRVIVPSKCLNQLAAQDITFICPGGAGELCFQP